MIKVIYSKKYIQRSQENEFWMPELMIKVIYSKRSGK